MLIASIFVFFCVIFTCIYNEYPFHNEQTYAKELITSIASYARTTGHLPNDEQERVPWGKIGISSTFFKIPHKKQYQAENEYKNTELLQYDCLYWYFENFCIRRFNKYKYQNENEPKSLMSNNENLACTLYFQLAKVTFPIAIDKNTLLKYAQYEAFYWNIPFHDLEWRYWEQYEQQQGKRSENYYQSYYVTYPNVRAMVIGYLI